MRYVLILCHWQGKILFVKKNKPAFMAGKLNLPGGKIEDGEDAVMATVREWLEEVGQAVDKKDIEVLGAILDNNISVYCCRVPDLFFEPKPRPEETEEFFWMDWTEAENDLRLMPNLRAIVPMMLMNKSWFEINDHEKSTETSHSIGVKIVVETWKTKTSLDLPKIEG